MMFDEAVDGGTPGVQPADHAHTGSGGDAGPTPDLPLDGDGGDASSGEARDEATRELAATDADDLDDPEDVESNHNTPSRSDDVLGEADLEDSADEVTQNLAGADPAHDDTEDSNESGDEAYSNVKEIVSTELAGSSDSNATRPSSSRTLAIVFGVAALALIAVGVTIESINHRRSLTIERHISDLRSDVKDERESRAGEHTSLRAASAKVQMAERKNGALLKRADDLAAQRIVLQRQVASLQNKVDALVVVPDVAGISSYEAESTLEDAGLTSTRMEIDGNCADYQGHFVDRGFGWDTVVRQETRPGTKVVSGAAITLVFFDVASGWELDCLTADY